MPAPRVGQPLDTLADSHLVVELDAAEAAWVAAREAADGGTPRLRFGPPWCVGLARHLCEQHGASAWACDRPAHAEALADAGISDLLILGRLGGPMRLRRLATLARRATLTLLVHDSDEADALAAALAQADATAAARPAAPDPEARDFLARRLSREPRLRLGGESGEPLAWPPGVTAGPAECGVVVAARGGRVAAVWAVLAEGG